MAVERPVISQHTNRPISKKSSMKNKSVIFWCGTCKLKLDVPAIAITHMNGRAHKAKLIARNVQDDASVPKLKRGLVSSQEPVTKKKNEKPVAVVEEPVSKKKKGKGKPLVVPPQEPAAKKVDGKPAKDDPNLKCDDCNLVFDNIATAIPHFKGKKHVAAISAKLTAKQNQNQMNATGQRGGRGRGGWGRGRGRGDGFRRGLGGAAAGELLRAMKNFYGRTDIYMPQNDFSGKTHKFQPNEWRNVDDVEASDEHGSYHNSTHGQLKSHFVQPTENSNIELDEDQDGAAKDKYDTHQVPPNYYGSTAKRETYVSGVNYNRNGYGSNTYNEPVYMNTNDKYSKIAS